MTKKLSLLASTLIVFAAIVGFAAPRANAQALVPYQATVEVNINNFVYTPVTIPSGYHLVVDFVSISGDAQANPYVQPIIIINSSINGGAGSLYYFAPPVSTVDPGQFYLAQQTTIYADSLSVGPAFAGYTPSSLSFSVTISGHLVKIASR